MGLAKRLRRAVKRILGLPDYTSRIEGINYCPECGSPNIHLYRDKFGNAGLCRDCGEGWGIANTMLDLD